ncbi:unnamed protein product [Bursaphelenchus okinawaensis]|uniref:K Homology domain-containing protein n=1 Tax=Bursaphelenchus okinawaensis TaxID=465554 RepID=A0A811JPU4_9BILA|nr:unnamed protein product [Bursaphelenchus okinawaensis]CAG9077060.1 unnamed protein product [Bursaphelenchus okinawaensis]
MKDYSDPLPGSWGRSASSYREDPSYGRDLREVDYRQSRDEYETRPRLDYDYSRTSPPRTQSFREERDYSDRKRTYDSAGKEPSFYTKKFPRMDDGRFSAAQGGSQLLQEETRRCLSEISQELAVIEQSPEIRSLPHTHRIVREEVENITSNTNVDWLDVESDKFNIRVYKRVLLPSSRIPGSNVVGKIMGAGGSTLKLICTKYKTAISVCGAGSRKDPKDEERLLQTGDPQYQHLNFPLHAEITTTGPPHLAYSRVADVLTILHLCCTTDEPFEYNGIRFESYGKRRESDGKYKSYKGDHDDRSRDRSTRGTRPRQDSESSRSRRDEPEFSRERSRDRDSDRGSTGGRGSGRGGRGGRGRGASRGGGFVPRGNGRGRGGFVPRR